MDFGGWGAADSNADPINPDKLQQSKARGRRWQLPETGSLERHIEIVVPLFKNQGTNDLLMEPTPWKSSFTMSEGKMKQQNG